jgi:putative oxidoreductase
MRDRREIDMTQALNKSAGGLADRDVQKPATSALHAFVTSQGRNNWLEAYGALAARILISQIFIISGVMKVLDPPGTAAQMEGRGMFWIPFFLWSAAAVEVAGGVSLLVGYKTRLGALLLILFLIPVTFTFHNFWTYPPDERQQQMFNFMHNFTLMGGLLLLMIFGPGPLSVDLRRRAS